jgi:hypothetical protein
MLKSCSGLAPSTTAGVYDVKEEVALGRFQAMFYPRPPHRGGLPFRFKILFHSLAWCGIPPELAVFAMIFFNLDCRSTLVLKKFGGAGLKLYALGPFH